MTVYITNPNETAMNALKDLKAEGSRIIVGLGEMLELGSETVSAHMEAGRMVAELGAYYFVAMGAHANEMITGAIEKGFSSERTVLVETHKDMSKALTGVMKEGDTVFLKGSRRAGLDKVVETLKGGC